MRAFSARMPVCENAARGPRIAAAAAAAAASASAAAAAGLRPPPDLAPPPRRRVMGVCRAINAAAAFAIAKASRPVRKHARLNGSADDEPLEHGENFNGLKN